MDDRDFEEECGNAYDYDEVNEDTSNIPDLPPVTMDDSELKHDDSATTNLSGTLQEEFVSASFDISFLDSVENCDLTLEALRDDDTIATFNVDNIDIKGDLLYGNQIRNIFDGSEWI